MTEIQVRRMIKGLLYNFDCPYTPSYKTELLTLMVYWPDIEVDDYGNELWPDFRSWMDNNKDKWITFDD